MNYYAFLQSGIVATDGTKCIGLPLAPKPRTTGSANPVITITPGEAAQIATAHLTLPTPHLHIGPDWTKNEWNMLAVGYPTWAWIDKPILHGHEATTTVGGITIHITTTKPTLKIDFGDGTRLTCNSAGTPWTFTRWKNTPGHKSPTCGHTWYHAGDYEVTATATWTIHWTGLDQSGTLTTTTTSDPIVVPIGELESVLIEP